MKTPKMLLFAVIPLAFLAHCEQEGRGVKLPTTRVTTRARFDPKQSTALFVGIRHFTSDRRLAEVPYAVDDAVDLAYEMAIARNTSLVPTQRVTLALSGEPHKMESKERLKKLKEAGARVVSADHASILETLRQQALEVGRDGIFIASFATHGFSSGGVPYVLSSTSFLDNTDSSLSTASVLETIGTSNARRSLVLIDACRQRIEAGTRASGFHLTTAPLIEKMKRMTGQVVLYAATAGNYAYDDEKERNGVFTAAILDGLRCQVTAGEGGLMTVDRLAEHARKRVSDWLKRHHHPADGAIQVVTDGETKMMPLAVCVPITRDKPAMAAFDGAIFQVFDSKSVRLWEGKMPNPIKDARVGALDPFGSNEVVVAAGNVIRAFRSSGEELWSADIQAESNYPGIATGRQTVRDFAIVAISSKKSRIVVLSSDAENDKPSRVSVFNPDGTLEGAYWDPGHLRQVTVGALTARHGKRIIVAGDHTVCAFDPTKVSGESPLFKGKLGTGSHRWYGVLTPSSITVDRVDIIDYDNNGNRDLALRTSAGDVLHLDLDGKLLGTPNRNAQFQLVGK